MLPSAERLKQRRDFGAAYRRGKRRDHPLLTLYLRSTEPNAPRRFGFSVSKKVGKAHERSRIKRRLREACRALPTMGGFDAVLVARPGADVADFETLHRALAQLLGSANVLLEEAAR
ncbi:MAG: ribonuclease P protein component [Armatimonas sp.]